MKSNYGPVVDANFMVHLVTMNENWLYHYDLQTKQQAINEGMPQWFIPSPKVPELEICWKNSGLLTQNYIFAG